MTTSLGKQKIKTKFKTPKANIVKILVMTMVLEKVDFQKSTVYFHNLDRHNLIILSTKLNSSHPMMINADFLATGLKLVYLLYFLCFVFTSK